MIKRLLLKLLGFEGPLNGWKSILGFILTLLPIAFPSALQGDITAFGVALSGAVSAAGAFYLSLGVLHKAFKNLTRDGANPKQ